MKPQISSRSKRYVTVDLSRAVWALCLISQATMAFAEGGGGGAIDGKGGSGPEPTSLALLGVATGIGLLIAKRRGAGEGEER